MINDSLMIVTGVSASANGWDTRVDGTGCPPSGCVPDNVLDNSIEDVSRWSCNAEVSDVSACELTLELDEPQDVVQIYMAYYKGDERTRSVNVWVDGVFQDTIASSGTTQGYEAYELIAPGATTVVLQEAALGDNEWLSITGVRTTGASVLVCVASSITARGQDIIRIVPSHIHTHGRLLVHTVASDRCGS